MPGRELILSKEIIIRVEFMDPSAVLELVGKPEINQLAEDVRERLERVLATV
jgi:hypothetical protein